MVSVIHRINAAFGASNKFVPYRPNWDLVAYFAQANSFQDGVHGGTVSNADLNDVMYSCNSLYHSPTNAPAGLPSDNYVFVRTTIYDKNAGMQELVLLSQIGETYKRMLYGGSWRAWKQVTLT